MKNYHNYIQSIDVFQTLNKIVKSLKGIKEDESIQTQKNRRKNKRKYL